MIEGWRAAGCGSRWFSRSVWPVTWTSNDLQSAHHLFHVTLRNVDFEGCLSRRLARAYYHRCLIECILFWHEMLWHRRLVRLCPWSVRVYVRVCVCVCVCARDIAENRREHPVSRLFGFILHMHVLNVDVFLFAWSSAEHRRIIYLLALTCACTVCYIYIHKSGNRRERALSRVGNVVCYVLIVSISSSFAAE
jgi:hypothetical protein